jgi:hypothetical protein
LPEGRLDIEEVSPDVPTPGSARSVHHQFPHTSTVVTDVKEVARPYKSDELTHVRTFRVFGAIKGGVLRADPLPAL